MSVSWNPICRVDLSPFCSFVFTCPVIKIAGTESKKQLPIPVRRFVAPGPLVANATPGLFLILP